MVLLSTGPPLRSYYLVVLKYKNNIFEKHLAADLLVVLLVTCDARPLSFHSQRHWPSGDTNDDVYENEMKYNVRPLASLSSDISS